MYEHPSFTHSRIVGEQERAARELERRRFVQEHASQIVHRERFGSRLVRSLFARPTQVTAAPVAAPARPAAHSAAASGDRAECGLLAAPTA